MTSAPATCPLCLPRADESEHWLKVGRLSISTLYLDRNQTYRGHCQLVYDAGHVVGIEDLPMREYARIMDDLYRAARAISNACSPDLMNYASMGNVVPHVHWHLVPRYKSDPRWGSPIYTSDLSDMRVTKLTDTEYRALAQQIKDGLPSSAA
jgi:diadenosine tetraphosphate (Ap4A) HIT family hydrolase